MSFNAKNALKIGAALLLAGTCGVAVADTATTKGGFAIKSDDGKYTAKIGGRIHLDSNVFLDDDDIGDQPTNLFFRRARLTLQGSAHGWKYKFENDFAGQGGTSGSGFREMWIGTKLAGMNLRLGQAKPYRAMEELTSSNEVLFMERTYSSASGLFDGRQFQLGAFLDGSASNWGWGASLHSLRSAGGSATDGVGFSGRAYFAPMLQDNAALHLGLSGSVDNPDSANANNNVRARARLLGRSSAVRPTFANTGEGSGTDQTTVGLEFGLLSGPLFVQAEFHTASFSSDANGDVDVDSYYVQGSYMLNGGKKRYDIKKGVFKSPSVKGSGVWEAKLRYDVLENDANLEISQLAVGMNYYVNSNIRVMVEYITADDESTDTSRSVDLLSTRIQFSF